MSCLFNPSSRCRGGITPKCAGAVGVGGAFLFGLACGGDGIGVLAVGFGFTDGGDGNGATDYVERVGITGGGLRDIFGDFIDCRTAGGGDLSGRVCHDSGVESFRGSGLSGGGSGAKVMSGLETRRCGEI